MTATYSNSNKTATYTVVNGKYYFGVLAWLSQKPSTTFTGATVTTLTTWNSTSYNDEYVHLVTYLVAATSTSFVVTNAIGLAGGYGKFYLYEI